MPRALVLPALPVEPGRPSPLPAVVFDLARALGGGDRTDVAVVPPLTRDLRSAVVAADLLLVATSCDGSGAALLRRLGDQCGPDVLRGVVAFTLVLGSWPDHHRQGESIRTLLTGLGATCLAPSLILDPLCDSRTSVASFSRYWAPAVPALRRLAGVGTAAPIAG